MEADQYQSSNINTLWLKDNVYQNIRNLENMVRLAREGCASLMEYMQIPIENRAVYVADIQYKNLRLMITELSLLLADLIPIIGVPKTNEYLSMLEEVEEHIEQRHLFIKDQYSASKKSIVKSSTTEVFFETLRYLETIRRSIIIDLSSVLYSQKENPQVKVNQELM